MAIMCILSYGIPKVYRKTLGIKLGEWKRNERGVSKREEKYWREKHLQEKHLSDTGILTYGQRKVQLFWPVTDIFSNSGLLPTIFRIVLKELVGFVQPEEWKYSGTADI